MTIFVDFAGSPVEPIALVEEIDCRNIDTEFVRRMLMYNLSILGLNYVQIGRIFRVDKSRVCRQIAKLTEGQKAHIRLFGFFHDEDE